MNESLLTEEQFLSLPDEALEMVYKRLCERLNNVCFNKLLCPGFKMESRGLLSGLNGAFGFGAQAIKSSKTDEYIENILHSTVRAYRRTGFLPKIPGKILRRTLTYNRLQEISLVLDQYKQIGYKQKLDLHLKIKKIAEPAQGFIHRLDEDEIWDQMEDDDNLDDNIKAQTIVVDEAKVLATLETGTWADLAIIEDKYTIRLGDGKYWVASDDVKIVMRDPSERPSWAIWFMNAVPLEKIPDRAAMMFMDPEEFSKYEPPIMDEAYLACHASLWKMKNKSLVILHTSWMHLSATYRWLIDKPIDVASVLFKTVSHPAHLARNFGYSPNLIIPGDDWVF